jgi:hypothetical protein
MFSSRYCLLVLFASLACSSATVNLRVDDNGPATREVQKIDCSAYDTRADSLRAGIDFGLLFGVVRGGPYVEKSRTTGVNWDKSVHQIVVQYKEVCSRYNSGAVSLASYDVRLAEIDQLWAEAQGIRQGIDTAIRARARESFDELERSTADSPKSSDEDGQRIASAIDDLVAKLGAQ